MERKSKKKEDLLEYLSTYIGPIDLSNVIDIQGNQHFPGKKVIYIQGKRITDAEAVNLKREAETIESTRLYKLFIETARFEIQREIFQKSEKSEDVFIAGKFWLLVLGKLENLIYSCKNPLLEETEKQLFTHAKKSNLDIIREEQKINNN